MSNVKVVRCPMELSSDTPGLNDHMGRIIFLAGGITNCPKWQEEMIKYAEEFYKSETPCTLIDPRRENFDVSNEEMSKEQIKWEFYHLRFANEVLFWFPEETLCPITLFELGSALERTSQVWVGCHPKYKRILDLRYQLANRRPDIRLVHSVRELAEKVFQ